ncbi:MAG TPA: hypothetical protein VLW85_11925 [Myxococcales bacterium]|nr:hypothetical protein [Myxococcales bacterium]
MIALLLAAGTVAVLPVEARPGALSAADAAALTDHLRAVAREALAPHELSVSDEEGADAVAVVRGRAAMLEGATVVAIGVYRQGASEPAGLVRIVGIGLPQLKADASGKLPKLLATSLGFAPPAAAGTQRPGTLRIPGGAPATAPASPPAATQAEPPAAASVPAPAPSAAPPANEDPLVTLIRQVTSDVERLRGLRRKQNLKVEILDDKLFSAALRAKAAQELTRAAVAAERARWLAFDLAPPTADPGQIMLDVLDEQVAGFYDQFSKQLIVRKEVPASAGGAMGPDGLRIVLAHEIEHALQDQNFGIPDLRAIQDDDAKLARSALFEGDAMAVMTAYAAQRARRPVKAAIAGGAAALRAVDTETLLRLSGKSPALASAPAILREELVLPYSAGFALVAEAFRRGGWPLVDRMFQHPPVSGQQVLHPELYFAGRTPTPVAPPAVPHGMKLVATGRMGELGTRLALEVCADKAVVKDFMPYWAGDAYVLVSDGKQALSVLWTTVWSDGAAANVGNVVKLESPCWEDQAASFAGLPGWRVDAASRSAVAGEMVAVARGSGDLDAAVRQQLSAKVRIPELSPPLGDAPPPALPKPVRIEDGRFVSEQLGLTGELPPEFKQVENPTAELSLQRAGFGGVTLALVPEPLAGDALDTFFQVTAAQLANAEGGHLMFSGRAQRKLAGATADERSWKIEGQQAWLRIELAPWCDGRGALALMRVERSEDARAILDRFADSVQHTPGKSPACADLE